MKKRFKAAEGSVYLRDPALPTITPLRTATSFSEQSGRGPFGSVDGVTATMKSGTSSVVPGFSGPNRPNGQAHLLYFAFVPIADESTTFGVLRLIRREKFLPSELGEIEAACKIIGRAIDGLEAQENDIPKTLLYSGSHSGVELVRFVNDSVLRRLAATPSDLAKLDPRRFEELLAELLRKDGWQTELTAVSRDGGYDILALKAVDGLEFQIIVQAKRFRRDRPVGVSYVRELYAVKQRKHVSKALLATTSYVSRDAKNEFRDVIPCELEIREHNDLLKWIRKHTEHP